MSKETILFVDYSPSGFSRYATSIVDELKQLNANLRFVAVYLHGKNANMNLHFDEVVGAEFFKGDPSAILEYYSPRCLFLFAHRFFDYMFTIEAHKKGILVFNFQHGLYMDTTVISKLTLRSLIQIFSKKKTQIRLYTRCIFYMNEKKIKQTLKMFFELMKYHSLYYVINRSFGKLCNADVSYVYGEYWKKYYVDQYGEIHSLYYVVGYPELEGEQQSVRGIFQNSLPTVCYLAQTSVEDGIVPLTCLNTFIDSIEGELGKINLIIKFHPRSNKEYYSHILSRDNYVREWQSRDFPYAEYYIGHESTVVARALYNTNRTMVYRLQMDRESPFEKYTKYVCKDNTTFNATLRSMLSAPFCSEVSDELKNFVLKNPNGAIRKTANHVIETLNEMENKR